MNRQESNRMILEKISEVIESKPDLRFHQILQEMGIEKPGEDRFYEESETTLKGIICLTGDQG